jgi:DNA polymerase-3 subunit gamma/tau
VDAQTRKSLQSLTTQLTTRDLVHAIKLFNEAQLDMRASDQSHLALELAFVEAAMVDENPAKAPVVVAPVTQLVRPAKAVSQSTPPPSRASAPAAPRRARAEPAASNGAVSKEVESSSSAVEAVTCEEVESNWVGIRQAIRAASRQVEALVNSAIVQGVEDRNRLVLEFASDFLSGKLDKEENRRVVEEALGSVLGKPCRVRGTTRGTTSGQQSQVPTSAPGVPTNDIASAQPVPSLSSATEKPGSYQDTASDPVIQDLVERGGRVTDVQILPEE